MAGFFALRPGLWWMVSARFSTTAPSTDSAHSSSSMVRGVTRSSSEEKGRGIGT